MSQEIIEGYRLSPQQRHLWSLRQSDRSAVCAVQINGELNIDILKRAIYQVAGREEILRTTFKLLPGMTIPVQVISDRPDVAFARNDLAQLSVDDQDAGIRALFVDAAERKIDYARPPLFHVDLIARSSINHVLVIGLPALCVDAPSLQCLVRQIAAAYTASSKAEELSNVETMQYADFAEWQNELLEAETGSVARQYWRKQDLSELDAHNFSFEKRIDAETTFQPATLPFEISAAGSVRIKAIANHCDASPSSFVLACWQILISRLTGKSNIVVGVMFDGRKFAELEEAIGLFSTFLPLRVDLPLNLSFEELLQQTSARESEAQRWQEYFSWDDVASSDEVTARFFPFCFEFHKHDESYWASDLKFSVYEKDACIDRFKIKLNLEDCEDRFSASLQFDASLFSIDDVRRLADQLKMLIEDTSNRPEAALDDLEVLSDEERQLVLVEFNETQRSDSSGKSVCELFEEQVSQRPDDVALICEAKQMTYRELNARANQLARHLLKLGVGPEVAVGLCLERSVELIVGLLGILKAGGVYVPLDPAVPQPRRSMMLEDAGARLLVSSTKLAAGLHVQLDRVVCLDADADAQVIANESADNFVSAVSAENLVYLIFTSGSTGRPKGVAVEHRQLVNYIKAIWERLDLPPGSSFATVSTIAADLGNTALFPALCKGGTLHLIAEERTTDPNGLADYFGRYQIDCLKIVPTHLSALLSAAHPAALLPRRRLVLGGEVCSWSLLEKIASLSPACVILNHYGPTEATVGAITNQLGSEASARNSETVPLGRPLANVQAHVLDQRMRPAPLGAPGELHLGGAGLARGYINRPDATAEKFIPNPFSNSGERLYKTGDLARYLGDGRIEFLGRVDHQVKIHGFRIEPGEIEIALLNCKDIAECIVVTREDKPGDKRLVAYVVARADGDKASASELRAFLNGRLPEYMVPSAFIFLDGLPLTPNGKVDRRALPAPDHSRADGELVFAAPRNPVEQTLAQIWSNVLGVDRVGLHDNFFDLGGDSILSIQIIARANQAGLGLSPRQLFQHQTVGELATVVGSAAVAIAEQGLVTGVVPLTPVQARFFELGQAQPHHYNQAMLLEVQVAADASLFARAINKLLLHHDALRLRFALNEVGWQGVIAPPDDVVPFELVDLTPLAEAEQSQALKDHAARLHASLNLQDGPLMRVALFDRGLQRNAYLLIVIHHLAMDGVSWRILLEDLEALYQQFSDGQKPSLPPKTTSFKTWAERLIEHARSGALRDELNYWLSPGDSSPARLPLDEVGGTNTVATARTISVSLKADETRALLQEVPVAYRTQINEVLLTALVRALAPWTGSRSLLMDLEGHGREEILEGVNLSRTVGWFTTIFPVLLDGGHAQSAVESLQSVKEQLRRIPNRGIGYGLLRYASGDSNVAEKFQSLPQAEVRFNYLGQVDRVLLDSSMFSIAPQPSGPTQSSKAERAYLLNIIGMVSGGELRLEWTFSESIHRKETVTRLAQSFVGELRTLIAQSRMGDKINYSPSDFPSAKLSQEELNKVLAKLRG
ncbi:MAG TPA: amino acid adenylation domain-containing protein [Pyrinomonadaceae bacterium]|nr:amino acid adenylation domain-containing protein [Pyrinomonadaceae bacterium]